MVETMTTATELSLFLENKPGVLAAVCRDLKRQKINVEAISVVDHVDHALVRMVTSDPRKAIHVLERAGVLVITKDVLRVRLADRPGALGDIAARLARSKVNIEYLYGTGGGDSTATLIVRVNDLARAKRALGK
jgi:hypothetical protein